MSNSREKVSLYIGEVKALDSDLQTATQQVKVQLSNYLPVSDPSSIPINCWRLRIIGYVILRLRHFIEHNTSYVETLSTLSLCRYLFELGVWVRHIERDERFTLLFIAETFEGQVQHYDRLVGLYEYEINLYQSLATEEDKLNDQALPRLQKDGYEGEELGRELAREIREIGASLDVRLKSELVLTSDDIEENGYRLQAALLKDQAIPQMCEQMQLNQNSLEEFEMVWKTELCDLRENLTRKKGKKKWWWDERSKAVGMEHDYKFIYSFTSRLLHATPTSIYTNQQNLTDDELAIFWRYIRNQFVSINSFIQAELKIDEASGQH